MTKGIYLRAHEEKPSASRADLSGGCHLPDRERRRGEEEKIEGLFIAKLGGCTEELVFISGHECLQAGINTRPT